MRAPPTTAHTMNTHLLRTMPQGVLSLSIEALWLANVIHDALDVALANSP
jgi:hypothetical protein